MLKIKLTAQHVARLLLTPTAGVLGAKAIGLSHPLGGCRMASDATEGVGWLQTGPSAVRPRETRSSHGAGEGRPIPLLKGTK